MANWVPVTRETHQEAGWKRLSHYGFALQDAHVPIVRAEMAHLVPTTPLAFIPRGVDEQGQPQDFQLVALQSISEGVNLFIHPDGRWLGGYIPIAYRGYPFCLMPEPESQQQRLYIDQECENVHPVCQSGDEHIFTINGDFSPFMMRLMDFLQRYERARSLTDQAVYQLAQAGVIVPWQMPLRNSISGHQTQPLPELHTVDLKALNQLDQDTCAQLTHSGAMEIAFTQHQSRYRLTALKHLYTLHHKFTSGRIRAPEIDLDALLVDEDDDLFVF